MRELPEGWKLSTLSEVAKWGSGGTPTSGRSDYYGGDIPWAVIGDMNDSYIYNTEKRITREGLDSSSAKLVPVGAVLIAMYGSIGKLGIAGIPMATNQAIAFALPNEEIVLQKFLFWFLRSQRDLLLWSGKGATQQNISQTVLKAWQIPLPSIPEQHQIVEILEDHLSRLDAALADVRQARVKATQFRTSYLRSVFTGTKDWSKIALKDLGAWNGGGTPSKSNSKFWTDGTVPWLSPKDMGSFEIKKTQDKITESAVGESTVKKIPPSSIVFVVRSGILERKLPIALTGIETTLNQDMKALTCNPQILPRFAMYALVAFEQDILTTCRKAGTTVASINTEALMNYSLNIPTIEIQQSILHEVESQISFADESAKYVDDLDRQGGRLRRSLLQAAFTGQLTRGAIHV